MKVSIFCETCGNVEIAKFNDIDPSLLGAVIVSCHATQPHCGNHKLVISTDSLVKGNNSHELYIKCTGPSCGSFIKEVRYTTYLELMSALTIAFHTEHEGHPLEIWCDGAKLHPNV